MHKGFDVNKTIPFSVNTWIFGAVSLEQVFQRVASIGFEGIELVGEPKMYPAAKVKQLAEDNGLKVCSICGMVPGPEPGELRLLSHPEAEERHCGFQQPTGCTRLCGCFRDRSPGRGGISERRGASLLPGACAGGGVQLRAVRSYRYVQTALL